MNNIFTLRDLDIGNVIGLDYRGCAVLGLWRCQGRGILSLLVVMTARYLEGFDIYEHFVSSKWDQPLSRGMNCCPSDCSLWLLYLRREEKICVCNTLNIKKVFLWCISMNSKMMKNRCESTQIDCIIWRCFLHGSHKVLKQHFQIFL